MITEETIADQIEGHQKEQFPVLESHQRRPTWSELLNTSIVVGGVDGEEVFEPGDVRVGVAASGT